MKRTDILQACLVPLFLLSLADAYTNLTPAELHTRLVNKDTLLILDVREWNEYTAGHIAAPAGQLPLTPACMPWNSSVLQANYGRLPKRLGLNLSGAERVHPHFQYDRRICRLGRGVVRKTAWHIRRQLRMLDPSVNAEARYGHS